MRYTAEPVEVSLVDHPCLPEATFAVVKADGSTELRKFKAGDWHESLSEASLRVERSNPAFGASESGLLRRPVGASRNDEAVAKVGARHSKADKERIKQSHDLLVALDPDCCPGAHIPGANVEPSRNFRRRPVSMATRSTTAARPKNWPRASNARCSRLWPRRLAACTRAWTIRRAVEEDRGSAAAARHHVGARRGENRGRDFSAAARSAARPARRARSAGRSRHPQGAVAADARHSGLSSAAGIVGSPIVIPGRERSSRARNP